MFDSQEWWNRYNNFRSRADELHRLHREGKLPDDDPELCGLVAAEMVLHAELPQPEPREPAAVGLEEAIADLQVTTAFQKPGRNDGLMLQHWEQSGFAGLPVFDSEQLNRHAAKIAYWLAQRPNEPRAESIAPANATPKVYLIGWPDILAALNLKRSDKGQVDRLNKSDKLPGPIIVEGQGSRPKVEKSKLLEWWNDIEASWQVVSDRQRDAAATTAGTYLQGKQGAVVVPAIGGSVKPRKKST